MKKILLLAALLANVHAFAQLPSYVPANGLVGYWPFSGNANDQSVNGLNATVYGASLSSDRFGNSNSAYSFNGTSDYIEILANPLLDITGPVTISCWIKKDIFNSRYEAILTKDSLTIGSPSGIDYKFQVNTLNQSTFYTSRGFGADTITLSSWMHLVGVSTVDSVKTYINGVLSWSTPNQFNTNNLSTNPNPLTFGRLCYFDSSVVGNERMYYEGLCKLPRKSDSLKVDRISLILKPKLSYEKVKI